MDEDLIPSCFSRETRRRVPARVLGLLIFGAVVGSAALAQQSSSPDKLTYIKIMKGSLPEYTEIVVDTNGAGTYQGRKLEDSPHPHPLQLSAATTQALFSLASQLGNFKFDDLESHKKVADLGQKTFIYQHGNQENKVEFNYTLNRKAQGLEGLFEGIAGVEQHILALEFSARYDRLNLPRELTQIEIDLNNKALVDPQLLTPILKKIAGNPQFLHIAQMRAGDILRRIQNAK